jgi:hypothetical protein
VNEQRISSEPEFSRVNDILQLQAIKATYCETVDACTQDGGKARISSVRFIQEG